LEKVGEERGFKKSGLKRGWRREGYKSKISIRTAPEEYNGGFI